METTYKEVNLNYCKNCQYWTTKEEDEPCFECLANPVNLNSHKPVNYKEKQNGEDYI